MSSPRACDAEKTAELRQAVIDIARRLVAGDLAIIAGCRELTRLGHHVVADWRNDPDFVVFGAVESETDHLPLEDVRPLWQPAAFAQKQVEVASCEAFYRDDVLHACRSVLKRFGPDGHGC